jgi:hypothetical protein
MVVSSRGACNNCYRYDCMDVKRKKDELILKRKVLWRR